MKPTKNYYRNIETYPKQIGLLSLTELRSHQDEDWYVRFRFYNEGSGKWKLFIKKGGANYKDLPLAERKAQIVALKKAVEYKLGVQQWNPITNTYPVPDDDEMELDKLQQMSFTDAIDFAVKMKTSDWKKKTKQDYASVVRYIKQSAAVLDLTHRKIIELRRAHYIVLLEKVKALRQLSNKGYNKYRDFLSSLMGKIEEFEILEYNPIHKIKMKETIKVVAHRPPTREQQKIIVSRIRNDYRNYYRFVAVVYGTTIRPKEICALKIKHLHKADQIFRIIPDREADNSKTFYERDVVIPDWLMDVLSELNLHNYDPEWYIFSTRNKYGTFMPGPNRMHSNTPTNWWRKIVKEGLKMDVDQYSLKKLAGNDMVKLQVQEGLHNLLQVPQLQMGHADKKMTEVYVDEHRAIINEMLKRKMPVL
jgi:integrase